MTPLLIQSIHLLAKDVHQIAKSKGFWDAPRCDGELIALIHSELSEWFEYLRRSNPASSHIPQFTGAEEEAADVIIRVLDLCEARGYRIGEALASKIKFNENRTYKHGDKKF